MQTGVVPQPGPEGSGFETDFNTLPERSSESTNLPFPNSQTPSSNFSDPVNFGAGYSSVPPNYTFISPASKLDESSEKPVPVPRKVITFAINLSLRYR